MGAIVSLRLPPQLLESARAAQLANRQRLEAREASARLRSTAITRASKAVEARGGKPWPGAVAEDGARKQTYSKKKQRRQVRGALAKALIAVVDNPLNDYTTDRSLRIYSLDGSTYAEEKYQYQDMRTALLNHGAAITSLQTFQCVTLLTLPVSDSSYLLVVLRNTTTTDVEALGVESSITYFGGSAGSNHFFTWPSGLVYFHPDGRVYHLYDRTETPSPQNAPFFRYTIAKPYLLGNDTMTRAQRAWLVHLSGVKEVALPSQFINNMLRHQAVSLGGYFYTGPNRPSLPYPPTEFFANAPPMPSEPSLSFILTHGEASGFPLSAEEFYAADLGVVQSLPIQEGVNTLRDIFTSQIGYYTLANNDQIRINASASGFVHQYTSRGGWMADYDEPTTFAGLQQVIDNPPAGFKSFSYYFTVTPPNNQALAKAPIAYFQDLGFNAADLTP